MKKSTGVRTLTLVAGGVFAVSGFAANSAQAKVSRKDYKAGAVALGVLGVILAAKGKTVPAVIAGAGAYYAYKKGQDTHDSYYPTYPDRRADASSSRDRYSNRYEDSSYNADANDRDVSYNDGDSRYDASQNVYPDAALSSRNVRSQRAKTEVAQSEVAHSESKDDADVSLD